MIDSFRGEYRFLSNFYWHNGWTVEHLFQAAKATNEKDRKYVIAADSPNEAKKRGHEIKCREDWEDNVDVQTMLVLLRMKFSIPEMRKKLLATSDQELVEGNWWHDNKWGNCTCARLKKCEAPGRNLLGRLLMHVRQEIILNLAFGHDETTWQNQVFKY